MKEEILFKDKDMLVMKLLHYFITEKGYNPIVLHGVQNEIWLENMEEPYKIVRIMTGYIHNNSQYDFDMFKTKRILQKIKLKTLTFQMKVLSIFTDMNDYVDITNINNIDCVNVNNENDIVNSKIIIDSFNDIDRKLVYSDDTIELFTKITTDINEKNKRMAKETEEIFKKKIPIVTYSLIAINILIFLMMYIFGSGSEDIDTLIRFGALSKFHTLYFKEYYRLFSAAFLHIGILHLLFNMYALYIIGPQVENFFGHIKYLLIYFVSILVASLVSFIFISPNTISAGASGAIFGLFGALFYFGYHYRAYLGNVIIRQIIPVILINLFIGIAVAGIDSAAHIGGLVGGLFIANAIGVKYKTTTFERINGWVVTILTLGLLIYFAFIK